MLDTLIKIVEEINLPKGTIEVFREEDGLYGIDIEGAPWSNQLTGDEAESDLLNIKKGVELNAKYSGRKERV